MINFCTQNDHVKVSVACFSVELIMNEYDVIVVGGGIVGSWAALQLSLKKKRVLLLEQYCLPHRYGSSTGKSRIIRHSYYSTYYAMMMPEAFKMWRDLESKANLSLLEDCELLNIFPDDVLRKISDNLTSLSIEHEFVKNVDIEKRFPGFRSPKLNAILEQSAGVLKADQCLNAVQELFKQNGGIVQDSEKVVAIQPINSDGVRIKTTKKSYFCGSVIVACGAWANKVLKSLSVEIPAKAAPIYSVYWRSNNPELYELKNGFPITTCDSELNCDFYSIPILEYPGLMKVCCSDVMREIDPDQKRSNILREKLYKTSCELIKHHFPDLIPEPELVEPCMKMETPDLDFVVDFHPKFKNIIIATGFSGHGFKLSPVVGKILCSLALKEEPGFPVDNLALSRFTVKPKL